MFNYSEANLESLNSDLDSTLEECKKLVENIKSSTNVLLIHGAQDDVVPCTNLLEAKDFLMRHKINVQTKIINNCAHHIPIDASST